MTDTTNLTQVAEYHRNRWPTIRRNIYRKELARVRATSMEGSFGTQKEHYDLKRVKARTKLTEILSIFFGFPFREGHKKGKRTDTLFGTLSTIEKPHIS